MHAHWLFRVLSGFRLSSAGMSTLVMRGHSSEEKPESPVPFPTFPQHWRGALDAVGGQGTVRMVTFIQVYTQDGKTEKLTSMQQNKLNNRHVDRPFGMHTYTNTSKDMQAGRQTPKYAIKMYIPLTWHQGLQGIHLLSSLCLFLPKFYILSINSLHSSCRERGSPLLMLRTKFQQTLREREKVLDRKRRENTWQGNAVALKATTEIARCTRSGSWRRQAKRLARHAPCDVTYSSTDKSPLHPLPSILVYLEVRGAEQLTITLFFLPFSTFFVSCGCFFLFLFLPQNW